MSTIIRRAVKIATLILRFLWEFTLSVWRVAWLVLMPGKSFRPGIFRFPLTVTSRTRAYG